MDILLQKHGAKHIYKVPEGLRELCTDISREVLRSQPRNIYDFIADYVNTLLVTRENTKVAVKVVNNILLGSQAILNVLYRAGLSLEQIAAAAPRIQGAFREYLDAVDMQPAPTCDDETCDKRSKVSLRGILQATGATDEDAECAATIIQTAFRGHLERMALNEAEGIIQWQKAVGNTLSILKKAGVSRTDITKATSLIKFAYSGYYTRRNRTIQNLDQELDKTDKNEAIQTIQAVAWMEMMYADSGLTMERANKAALTIQVFSNHENLMNVHVAPRGKKAYKRYRVRKGSYDVQKLESTKSMVVEAILENLRLRLFKKVMSREDIPEEYGTRDDMIRDSLKLQTAFKDHLRRTRMSEEGFYMRGEDEEGGEENDMEEEEGEKSMIDKLQQSPSKSDIKTDQEHANEGSIKLKMDDGPEAAAENNLQRIDGGGDLKSESAREEQQAVNSQLSESVESTPDVPINAQAPAVGEEEKDEEQGHKGHEEQKAPLETTITDDTAA